MNGHSCRRVSTWNLSVLNSHFAVLWLLFQDSYFPLVFIRVNCLFHVARSLLLHILLIALHSVLSILNIWVTRHPPPIGPTLKHSAVLPPINAVKLETQVVIQLKCRPGVLRVFQIFDCILVKSNCLSWLELLREWESQAKRTGVWSFKAAI